MVRKALWMGLFTLAAGADPLRFGLDQPFDKRVVLDGKTSVRLIFRGKEVLELEYGRQKQTLPLESVATEGNPQARGEVVVEDFDFDGHKDIGVPTGIGYGGVNVFYEVYRLEGKFRAFPGEWAVCNPEFSPGDRTLITNSRSGPFWYGVDYRFAKGRPWVWRRRLPVTLDELAAEADLITLFETYDARGRVVSARLSGAAEKWVPISVRLSKPVVIFPSPGSRGTLGSFRGEGPVALGAVESQGGHVYAQIPGKGWFLLPEGSIHR